MNVVNMLLARLREPSTWATITALLGGAGLSVTNDMLQAIAGVGMAVSALLGIFLKEKAEKAKTA